MYCDVSLPSAEAVPNYWTSPAALNVFRVMIFPCNLLRARLKPASFNVMLSFYDAALPSAQAAAMPNAGCNAL